MFAHPIARFSSMKKLLLTTSLLITPTIILADDYYNLRYAKQIVDDNRNNEPRFNRDFKSKPFLDVLVFKSISQTLWKWQASFDGAYCFVDEKTARSMIDWNKGQQVTVYGTINDTMFGDIHLDSCQFKP